MELKFKNHKFRIMIIGDPHEKISSGTEKEESQQEDYLRLQYAAVQKLSPDLVVLMGDNATGETPAEIKKVLTRITAPYAAQNIPFTFVLGNHDLECEVDDLHEQYEIYRSLPCCILPDKEKVNTYGDYNITVKAENSDEDIINLWFMYSGNLADKKFNSTYDFVKTEQIEWYEKKAAELTDKNRKTVPAVLFQHIPVPEEFSLLKKRSMLSMLGSGVEGQHRRKNSYYTLDKNSVFSGYMGEAPCPPDYNNGQFASWKKTGDVFAAFFGHDHMNDFIGMTDGIILGQCKTASFKVYGDGMMQGVRILDLNDKSPTDIKTEMVYYRDIVGNDCKSLSGAEKNLRDRTSVKLETAMKFLPALSAVILPIVLLAKRKK